MEISEIALRKIKADSDYIERLIEKFCPSEISPALVSDVINALLLNAEHIKAISVVKGVSSDFILLHDMMRYKMVLIISAIYLNLKQSNQEISIEILEYELFKSIIISDLSNLDGSTVFLSNPVISNIMNMIKLLKENVISVNVDSDFKKIYYMEINNILDAIYSMFILFNKKCFSQSMSVFRQALEQFITMKALDMNKNALDSFSEHQTITILDATRNLGAERLDEYIKSHNLTYNNYKSYLNYGWLDEVEAFRRAKEEKPKIKYSIKTVADISGQSEFYEAMDFASNYVHSNFVFVDLNWNMIISEVIDGCYEMLDWIIDVYKNITPYDYVIEGFEYLRLYNEIKEKAKIYISNDLYDYNIK